MNYGRKNASKQHKKISSKATMKKKRAGVRFFKSFLIICLIICVLGVIAGGIIFKKIIDDTPVISADDLKPKGYTTNLLADDGTTVIDTLVTSGSNRIYVSIDQVPEDLQNAFIAVEDSRFREHNGIDLKGIVRAGITGITSGSFSQGASTITQQLIKNSIFPDFVNETTWEKIERKIQEIYLAVQIEKEINDKDVILENYLNTINLGQNTLGVQAASKRYFGKDVSELTLSESATIAAITKSPTDYNPITNPDKNADRREKVLNDMMKQGYITQTQVDEALADNVYERISEYNTTYTESQTPTSYFVDEVTKQVIKDLRDELGYTDTQASNAVYGGGLTIVTTQNVKMQQIAEEEMNDDSNYPSTVKWGISGAITITHEDGTQTHYDTNMMARYAESEHDMKYGETYSSKEKAAAMLEEYIETLKTSENDTVLTNITYSPQPQASVVVMDQSTGHVKAMVGGRGEKTQSMSLNRATQSVRQAGSTFKVLSTYVPALDAYGDTLATVIVDEPYSYSNGRAVRNHWSGYKGPLTIRECIKRSANVCTVKKYTEITPALGYSYLTENLGITTLNPEVDSVIQATCLGGTEGGVTNIELTAAYASIANGGVYTEPILYTEIYDHDGNLLYENTPETHTAMKETTAALITDAMEDVVTSGTGTAVRFSGMAIAGKTGTTTDTKDLWFSGYTPYLTASVWVGFDEQQTISATNTNKVIWREIMRRIHEDYEYKSFSMPSSISRKTVCTDTGKLASTEFCKTYSEYFAPGTAPSQSCPGHPDREEEARLAEEEEERKQEELLQQQQQQQQQGETTTPPETTPTTPTTPAQ